MSSNLVKYFFTNLSQDEEKRVIDSNEAVRRRLEKLVEEGIIPSQSGEMQSENGEFVAGLAAETIEAPDSGSNILKAQDEAKEILSQAEADAESIRAEAEEEAARIRQEARTQAENEKAEVLGQARQDGYNEGLAEAQVHENAMEQEYREKMHSLEEEFRQMTDTLEPRFVSVITGIYEHIFNIELSSYREILTSLISGALHKLEGSRNFIIHVSKEDYAYVSMQKKQMLAGVVSENVTVDVVEDLTLGRNECMIETEGGIFDCGLDSQLSELRKRLMLLSWSDCEKNG